MDRISFSSRARRGFRPTKWRALLAASFGLPIAFATLLVVATISIERVTPHAGTDPGTDHEATLLAAA